MLDPRLLRQDIARTAANLARRSFTLDVGVVARIEEQRKQGQVAVDALRNERNARSKAIGAAKGRGEDIAPLLAEVEDLGERIKREETALEEVQAEWDAFALGVPNLLDESVPDGTDETANVELY